MPNRHHPQASSQNTKQRLICLAVAGACAAAAAPAFAQQAAPAVDPLGGSAAEPTKVVVTGIRAAMQSTLNLKRNSDGFVDGIVADDIGKFPDTNLAESLQRISGVSIDRNQGEGANVTVRGVGPDLNMVLLNGRQMPTSNLRDQNGRAFDFSNLASESISQIQVYKSARADTPPGGIGATLNVMTARPFDNPNGAASIGVKAVYDTSNDNLPAADKAKRSLTPEISGIYSTIFGNGMWGFSASGSYQERNLGVNTASITNGYYPPKFGRDDGDKTIPLPGEQYSENIVNRPEPGDLYLLPKNTSYFMRGAQRQRTNGQLTLQFKPNKDITSTLDYTYSQNKVQTKYHELSVWFNIINNSFSEWTDGPLASPLYYGENVDGKQDVNMNGGDFATKSENKSLGFNTVWKVNNKLRFTFDAHRSSAESKADSPWGSNNDLATASFSRGRTIVDFRHEMPVVSIEGYDPVRAPRQVTGSWFQNGYQKMEIDQLQLGGRLSMLEASTLNFGVSATNVKNRTAFQNVQRDEWGGATKPEDYPASMFTNDTLGQYFDKLGGHDSPALFQHIQTFNFAELRQRAADATGLPHLYQASLADPDWDRRTTEKSKALYLQFSTEWDTAMPMHTGIGVRYEKTDVYASALSKSPTGTRWGSQNEQPLDYGPKSFTSMKGSYNNLLPTVDWDMEVRPDFKVRASYGHTIGRPRFDQIMGGTSIDPTANLATATGQRGNPALKPVKSKNLDLSAEWYYGKQNVLSLGLFHKKLSNYAGQQVINETGDAHTPVGGAYWNAAVAAGCDETDTNCIRNYIFTNFDGQPGVTRTGVNDAGNITGVIRGLPSDPLLNYRISTFVNEKNAKLKGAELNVQHMFGASGFGIQANYTYVDSDLTYNNLGVGNQFALIGLSDSANLIGIFENDKWSIRAAYNWRDEFLSGVADGNEPNPSYVEAYGQLDLSVGYNWTKNLSLQFEAINVLDETIRTHGRSKTMVLQAIQGGPRYMLSARYKF